MCKDNKQKLLGTTYSGPIEYCDTSPIYICGGEEILGDREIAKAKFETCLANDKNALCTTALNNDALQKRDGGPYTSPTPSDMSSPVGDDCNIQYWYCKDKIYKTQEGYEGDNRCKIKNCEIYNPAPICRNPRFKNRPECRAYASCMGW